MDLYGSRVYVMELPVTGSNYYANKRKLFDHVVGFATFSEFLVVAEARRFPVVLLHRGSYALS
jgi:hypothetical protein